MIDRNEAIETLKLAHDALVDTYPAVMERIFHDETLLDDKTTPDYKTALAICSIMDVIEQLKMEPEREDLEPDFDDTRFLIRGMPLAPEFWDEQQAIDYLKKIPVTNPDGVTYQIIVETRGAYIHEHPHCTIHLTAPQGVVNGKV